MKASIRFSRILSVFAAISLTMVSQAQPPPGGPGSPDPEYPGPGFPGEPGPRPPIPPPSGIEIAVNAGDSSVARVQRALKKRGYYFDPVDGNAGRSTRSAIRNFRTDNGFSPTSRIDGVLLRTLGL